jgi:hypothetical protein
MAEPQSAGASHSIHFAFKHKLFEIPGARFTRGGRGGAPVLWVRLDGAEVPLPLVVVRAEFAIAPDSPDGELLTLIEHGLSYVKDIRPGDSVPRRLLDGTAAWRLEERHLAIAKGRMAVRISDWLGGAQPLSVGDVDLENLIDHPHAKLRMKMGTAKLAEKLGLGARRRLEVVERIDVLARELAYIEALRERQQRVRSLLAKVEDFAGVYGDDPMIGPQLSRIRGLLLWPVEELHTLLGQADAMTGDPLGLLLTFEGHVTVIRDLRDALDAHLAPWDAVLDQWLGIGPVRSPAAEAAIHSLLRFAAQQFAQKQPAPQLQA